MAEFDFDPATQTSTLIREYVWFEGKPIAVIKGEVVYYVGFDHIGKPVFATDATGTKVWEATYLSFGGIHTFSGANINLRFPGQWFKSESGLLPFGDILAVSLIGGAALLASFSEACG